MAAPSFAGLVDRALDQRPDRSRRGFVVRDARRVLRERNLSAKKSFGQNFLVSPHVVEAIAHACVPPDEIGRAHVVEFGAGLGVLTEALASRAAGVVAVERDRDLLPILADELKEMVAQEKVTLVEGDAQTFDLIAAFEGRSEGRVLAGNLPYQVTGRLLERAVIHAAHLDRVVFMVQREVADRLVASPATKDYGALTVFARAAFSAEKRFDVTPGSFYPSPEVTSSVVVLTPVRPRRAEETDTFRALVRGAFGMRRKTLRNAWGAVALPERVAQAARMSDISLDLRGEVLDVDAFARMANNLDHLHAQ